jgi:hypothetical protein
MRCSNSIDLCPSLDSPPVLEESAPGRTMILRSRGASVAPKFVQNSKMVRVTRTWLPSDRR